MLFNNNDKKTRRGFNLVKRDFAALKNCLNEWVLFLNGNQREMKMRLMELERKVAKLEAKQSDKKIEVLRYV